DGAALDLLWETSKRRVRSAAGESRSLRLGFVPFSFSAFLKATMPPSTLPLVTNRQARRLLLQAQGLAEAPNRKLDLAGLLALIEQLGFVQVDSINIVERAHHQILFSRNQTYRQKQLTRLLEKERSLFENWTHDAAILPSRFWPWWQPRFARAR